jgi:hypothetical protein
MAAVLRRFDELVRIAKHDRAAAALLELSRVVPAVRPLYHNGDILHLRQI